MTTNTRPPRHLPSPRRTPNIPDTPEAQEHAQEAEAFKQDLHELGIDFEMISPTSDGRGHARLNFDQLGKLLDLVDELKDKVVQLNAGHYGKSD